MLRRYNGNKGNNSGGDINDESAPVLPDPGNSTPLLSSPLIHYGQLHRRRLMMIFFFFFVLLTVSSSYLGRFLFENTMSLILYQRQYKQHYWNDAFEISSTGHNQAKGYGYCTLETCLDSNKCHDNKARNIYIYPPDASHVESFFRWAGGSYYRQSQQMFEDQVVAYLQKQQQSQKMNIVTNPDDACLFLPRMYVHTRNDVWEGFALFRLRSLPHWDIDGRNHIIVDPGDDMYRSIPQADKAIFLRAAFHQSLLRGGYDVQTLYSPFKNLSHRVERNSTSFLQRPILASFKGKQKVRLRANLANMLGEEKDVIVLVEGTTSPSDYNAWDYDDLLLRSRFCIAPRGLGLHSYRMAECMSAGCIPVIISDGYAWPDSDMIGVGMEEPRLQWDELAIRIEESSLDGLVQRLRSISDAELIQMHQNVLLAYSRLKTAGALHPIGGILVVLQRIEKILVT